MHLCLHVLSALVACLQWDTSGCTTHEPLILQGGYSLWCLTYGPWCVGQWKRRESSTLNGPNNFALQPESRVEAGICCLVLFTPPPPPLTRLCTILLSPTLYPPPPTPPHNMDCCVAPHPDPVVHKLFVILCWLIAVNVEYPSFPAIR